MQLAVSDWGGGLWVPVEVSEHDALGPAAAHLFSSWILPLVVSCALCKNERCPWLADSEWGFLIDLFGRNRNLQHIDINYSNVQFLTKMKKEPRHVEKRRCVELVEGKNNIINKNPKLCRARDSNDRWKSRTKKGDCDRSLETFPVGGVTPNKIIWLAEFGERTNDWRLLLLYHTPRYGGM